MRERQNGGQFGCIESKRIASGKKKVTKRIMAAGWYLPQQSGMVWGPDRR
jgi:hypothetical protein